MDENITRVFDLLPFYKNKFKPKADVLAGKDEGQLVKYDIKKNRNRAQSITTFL